MPKFSIEKLNEIRNSKGYTLKELAEMAGIPNSTISKIFVEENSSAFSTLLSAMIYFPFLFFPICSKSNCSGMLLLK